MQILVRTISVFISVLFHICVTGQVISFYNDSLKINKIYINAHTTPKQLDLLLGAKHSTVKTKSDLLINTHTGKKIKQVTLYYPTLGLSFCTYEDDPAKYSFSIMLSPSSTPHNVFEKKLKKPFSGYLFIASNDLTRKTSIDDFKRMENVSVSFQEVSHGNENEIKGGEIFYQKDRIRLSVDGSTKDVTAIHFYHHYSMIILTQE